MLCYIMTAVIIACTMKPVYRAHLRMGPSPKPSHSHSRSHSHSPNPNPSHSHSPSQNSKKCLLLL